MTLLGCIKGEKGGEERPKDAATSVAAKLEGIAHAAAAIWDSSGRKLCKNGLERNESSRLRRKFLAEIGNHFFQTSRGKSVRRNIE